MTDERPPTETLRAAALRLRQVAGAATPGPWVVTREVDEWWWPIAGGARSNTKVADAFGIKDAAYIATMHPGVAVALAAWLDREAGWGANGYALNVARAVLREA